MAGTLGSATDSCQSAPQSLWITAEECTDGVRFLGVSGSYYAGATPRDPNLWLGLSIGATLLCCTPAGIVGIVFSALAMDARSHGDLALWERRVELARVWTLWSIGLGVAVLLVAVCFLAMDPNP
jgi:hypothetical protein